MTQDVGKRAIDVHALGIDFASCSAHKIHCPNCVGAALVKIDAYGIEPISSFLHGGEQENGFHAGTLAVHNIVGFGKAAEIALRDLKRNIVYVLDLDSFAVEKFTSIESISLTNPSPNRQHGIISLVVAKRDFNNKLFIKEISSDFVLSTGSA